MQIYEGKGVACKFIEKMLEKGKFCEKIFKNKIQMGTFHDKLKWEGFLEIRYKPYMW